MRVAAVQGRDHLVVVAATSRRSSERRCFCATLFAGLFTLLLVLVMFVEIARNQNGAP